MNEQEVRKKVVMAQNGDQESFIALYSLYYKEMYAYACYMLNQKQDAEDAVSDTVMAAFEGIRKLRDPARFRQWIFKILSNQCKRKRKEYADNARRMQRQSRKEGEAEEVLQQVARPGDMAEQITECQWVREAFAALSEEEKYIVNSFLLAGYKGDEIALSLGITSSTVRSKYRRALQKMKKYMEK